MVIRTELSFRPIDLAADRSVLLAFARDLFAVSFSDPNWFTRRFGADGSGYLVWLREAIGSDKQFASFALLGDRPVGMVVLGYEPGQPTVGHVFHYYLTPDVRGSGLGKALNEYALAILAQRGMVSARLHVAPNNIAAIRFYAKYGWTEAGEVAGKQVMAMTASL